MLTSPRSHLLDLESNRLHLSAAIAQQSPFADRKPQQQADRHEGEGYKQVEASGGQGCPSQKQGTRHISLQYYTILLYSFYKHPILGRVPSSRHGSFIDARRLSAWLP
jgi:hypothetical protein